MLRNILYKFKLTYRIWFKKIESEEKGRTLNEIQEGKRMGLPFSDERKKREKK